ncbi:MAG TPA: hypothetical protein VFN11_07725 [Ktedonobacterales bacterium]|nr:hypothetical protein [Ktedonobacterales bacterium]
MGDDWTRWLRDAAPDREELTDELERQARETIRVFRDSMGDLGTRVRQVLGRANELWDATSGIDPDATGIRNLAPANELRARALARRWVERDFLVDPELPDGMRTRALYETAVWKVELSERGETRALAEGSSPWTGTPPPPPSAILPVWDYIFPATPEIASGERRERLAGSELAGACLVCNGTGHRDCADCSGKGFIRCPDCQGKGRITCRRCRGRGRIADAAAERKARAAKGYFQVQAERLAVDAAEKLADFSERLRQDYGVPLPPSAQWAPTAPASGETIPCPDCLDGTIACSCKTGKRVCATCRGSGYSACTACDGSARVIRYREVVRRFDTRTIVRTVMPAKAEEAGWLTSAMIKRANEETAWEGALTDVVGEAPLGVPAGVWAVARALVNGGNGDRDNGQSIVAQADDLDRHVIGRRLRLTSVPVTHVEYTFDGRNFDFTSVGSGGAERFWADEFPARWTRMGRFFRAVVRDLNGERDDRKRLPGGPPASLDAYRARSVRIMPESTEEVAASDTLTTPITPETPAVDQPPARDGE